METRYAIVRNASSAREVRAYLPDNYSLIWQFVDGRVTRYDSYVIEGKDVAGWTLDDYVRPRLASGLMSSEEIDRDHPLFKDVPPETCVYCGMGRGYHGADMHPFNGPIPGHGPENFDANGDHSPPPEACVICGEPVVDGAEKAEMYEPADPDSGRLAVVEERSGVVHASCGVSRGWEVS